MCFEFVFRGNRYFVIIYIDECHILFLDDVFVNNYNVAMAQFLACFWLDLARCTSINGLLFL